MRVRRLLQCLYSDAAKMLEELGCGDNKLIISRLTCALRYIDDLLQV